MKYYFCQILREQFVILYLDYAVVTQNQAYNNIENKFLNKGTLFLNNKK